jgi:hypothetical protein
MSYIRLELKKRIKHHSSLLCVALSVLARGTTQSFSLQFVRESHKLLAVTLRERKKKQGHNSQGTTNIFSSTGELQSQNAR